MRSLRLLELLYNNSPRLLLACCHDRMATSAWKTDQGENASECILYQGMLPPRGNRECRGRNTLVRDKLQHPCSPLFPVITRAEYLARKAVRWLTGRSFYPRALVRIISHTKNAPRMPPVVNKKTAHIAAFRAVRREKCATLHASHISFLFPQRSTCCRRGMAELPVHGCFAPLEELEAIRSVWSESPLSLMNVTKRLDATGTGARQNHQHPVICVAFRCSCPLPPGTVPASVWKLPCTRKVVLDANLLTRFTGEIAQIVIEMSFDGAMVFCWSGWIGENGKGVLGETEVHWWRFGREYMNPKTEAACGDRPSSSSVYADTGSDPSEGFIVGET